MVESSQEILSSGSSSDGRLWEGEAEFEVHDSESKGWVSYAGVNARAKSEIQNAGGSSGGIESNVGHEFAGGIAKAKASEVVNGKDGGFNAGGDSAGFKRRIVRATGNVVESGNQLSRTVYRSIFEEGVREVVEATGFYISRGGNRRRGGNEEVDCVGGATESQRDEGRCGANGIAGRGRIAHGTEDNDGLRSASSVEPCNDGSAAYKRVTNLG
jgi:hypothetical protein